MSGLNNRAFYELIPINLTRSDAGPTNVKFSTRFSISVHQLTQFGKPLGKYMVSHTLNGQHTAISLKPHYYLHV